MVDSKESLPKTVSRPSAERIDIYDGEGNSKPLMLSELLRTIQKILEEEGDMPVWLEVDELGYDDTITINKPACFAEVAPNGRKQDSWWSNRQFKKWFKFVSW